MGLIKATLKTVCEKVNQDIYNRKMRSAQKDAYKTTCKKSKGFNPNWHTEYSKRLQRGQRKASDRRELRSTFISNL